MYDTALSLCNWFSFHLDSTANKNREAEVSAQCSYDVTQQGSQKTVL